MLEDYAHVAINYLPTTLTGMHTPRFRRLNQQCSFVYPSVG